MTNEELQEEVKRLEEQIKDLKAKLEEECFLPYKPYEVEVPEDIEYYLTKTQEGREYLLMKYNERQRCNIYKRGLAFREREDLLKYEKERVLLFKLHKWAEEHNEGWTPNWNDEGEKKYYVTYNEYSKEFETIFYWSYQLIPKLPIFKSREIAEQFIKEFGDEIKEVLC